MNKKSLLVVTSVCAGVASLAMGCGPGAGDTSYRDFFTAIATVFQADGTSAAARLPISAYNWVVTFTDGSTVANPMGPTGALSTDATGKFTFESNQLALKSGTLVNECTSVCVDWETGTDDVCADWEVDSEEYCADWETNNSGNDYCADWEVSNTTYCASWVPETYEYCAAYGQDCGYVYPSRAVTDISSAYAEITYADGATVVSTQSQVATLPAKAIQSTSTTDANNNTIVSTKWVETDTFVTSLTQNPAASTGAATAANRAAITAARNAPKLAGRKMRMSGTPHFGRTHKPATTVASELLVGAQKTKLDAIRATCAYPKPTK